MQKIVSSTLSTISTKEMTFRSTLMVTKLTLGSLLNKFCQEIKLETNSNNFLLHLSQTREYLIQSFHNRLHLLLLGLLVLDLLTILYKMQITLNNLLSLISLYMMESSPNLVVTSHKIMVVTSLKILTTLILNSLLTSPKINSLPNYTIFSLMSTISNFPSSLICNLSLCLTSLEWRIIVS